MFFILLDYKTYIYISYIEKKINIQYVQNIHIFNKKIIKNFIYIKDIETCVLRSCESSVAQNLGK